MKRSPTKPDPTEAALPNDARLDPVEHDITVPRRKRRARKRTKPRKELEEAKASLRKRADARPYPPGVMLEPAGLDEEHWTPPHSDSDLWALQLADAFGTRSQSVITTFMRQLEALCDMNFWDEDAHQWRLDEHTLNAALAIVNSVKPRNEVEACLAAEMVAVHLLTMKTAARAIKYDYETQTAAVAARLARAFTDQIRTMQELKGQKRTTRQSIKVSKELHQHVHYHRGDEENRTQSHATEGTGEPEERAALPGPDEEGKAVPLAGRKR